MMATRTSVQSGLWSDPTTWDTGVPVDGDSFVIAAGHLVTFDADQGAMTTGMAAGTIGSGATLKASETPGVYHLKMAATLYGPGTLSAGTSKAVPYPSNCTFTYTYTGSGTAFSSSPLVVVALYCYEPTVRYAFLTSQTNNGSAVLNVDTDLRGIWADGQDVYLSTPYITSVTTRLRTIGVGGVAEASITVTATLDANMPTGTIVVLVNRNVRVLATNSAAYVCVHNGAIFYAEFRNFARIASGGSEPLTLGGVSYAIQYPTISGAKTVTLDGAILGPSNVQPTAPMRLTGSYLSVGNNTRPWSVGGKQVRIEPGAKVYNQPYGFQGGEVVCDGLSVSGARYPCYSPSGLITNSTFVSTATSAGIALMAPGNVRFENCLFTTAAAEVGRYADPLYRLPGSYAESVNHNQVAGAFRSWTHGGIISSVVDVVPTGKARSYRLACETTSYPGFMQSRVTVGAGETLRVRCWLRKDAAMAYLPRVQIILASADPLTNSAASPTAEAVMTDSVDTWELVSCSWTNSTSGPMDVMVRCQGKNASGNVWFYPEWSVNGNRWANMSCS